MIIILLSFKTLCNRKCRPSKGQQYFQRFLLVLERAFCVVLNPRAQIIAPPIVPHHYRNVMLFGDPHLNACPNEEGVVVPSDKYTIRFDKCIERWFNNLFWLFIDLVVSQLEVIDSVRVYELSILPLV